MPPHFAARERTYRAPSAISHEFAVVGSSVVSPKACFCSNLCLTPVTESAPMSARGGRTREGKAVTDTAAQHAYDLAAALTDQVAIDNACLALVTVFPETAGRVDVYLPDFVQQRGFELPGKSPAADRFWM